MSRGLNGLIKNEIACDQQTQLLAKMETNLELPAVLSDRKRSTASIVTYQDFSLSAAAVWNVLMFYEEITETPPWLLSWFLPVPLSTSGRKSEVGNILYCRYNDGYLCKLITNIVDERSYAFDITEQHLSLRGIILLGGDYTFSQLSAGRTRVALTTRYSSRYQPRWLCRWLEGIVCHSFHRHILNAMRNKLA
jgi:hypothetical protein